MLPTDEPRASADMLRDALLEFCAANGVVCLDALDAFARDDTTFDHLFIPGDDHFSAAGNMVIGDLLVEPLESLLTTGVRTPRRH
jgi:hypothetical protein